MAIESFLTTLRGGTAVELQTAPPAARGPTAAISDAGVPAGPARSGRRGEPGEQALERQAVTEAVTRIQDFVQTVRRELQFRVDEGSGETIVRVVDRETNEVIRQIPPEEILEVSRKLRALAEGLLIEERA